MVSALLAGLLTLYAWTQRNLFLAALLLPPIFFYALAYELRDLEFAIEYFDFNRIYDFDLYILFGIIQIATAILVLNRRIFGFANELQPPALLPSIPVDRARSLYYYLALTAIAAFVVNMTHVGFDISLALLNPREYEAAFGQNTFINYLYFLNIPALCLSIYLQQHKKRPAMANPIDALLVLMSFFHGIKFTVFDTLLLPTLFYFYCSRRPQRALKAIGWILLLLLAFYLAFSLSIRGFTDAEGSVFLAIVNYILPNYYNFAHAIQSQPFQFDLLGPILPDKIPNPFRSILPIAEYGFVLNDSFNMPTAYSVIYAFLPPVSWFLFVPILILWRNRIVRQSKHQQTVHWIFLAAYVDFCLFFFWYFYAFNKTKYVYYVAVMLFLGFLLHHAPRKRLTMPLGVN